MTRHWRTWAWAVAVVALVLTAALIPVLFVIALLPPLDHAFASYHRARDGKP